MLFQIYSFSVTVFIANFMYRVYALGKSDAAHEEYLTLLPS